MSGSSSRLSVSMSTLVAVSLVAVSLAAAVSVGGSAFGTGEGGGDPSSDCFTDTDPCTEPIHVRETARGQQVEYLGENILWYRQGTPSDSESGHTWYQVRSGSVLAGLGAGVFTFGLRDEDNVDVDGKPRLIGFASLTLTRPGPDHLRVVDGAVVYGGSNILWYRPHNDIGGDASDWERARRWSDDGAITVSVPRGGKHLFHIRDRSSSGYPVLYTAVKNVPPAARRVTTTTTAAPVTPLPNMDHVDCDALIADRRPSEWTEAELGHCTPDADDEGNQEVHLFPPPFTTVPVTDPPPRITLPEVDCDALSNNPSEWTQREQDQCTPDGPGAVPRPSGLTAVYSQEIGAVRLSWDKVTRPNKEVRYVVQRKGPGDTRFKSTSEFKYNDFGGIDNDKDTVFTDYSAKTVTQRYHYRVKAVVVGVHGPYADGDHGPYADASVTIPLGPPRNIVPKITGAGHLVLRWTPPAGLSNQRVSYTLHRYNGTNMQSVGDRFIDRRDYTSTNRHSLRVKNWRGMTSTGDRIYIRLEASVNGRTSSAEVDMKWT